MIQLVQTDLSQKSGLLFFVSFFFYVGRSDEHSDSDKSNWRLDVYYALGMAAFLSRRLTDYSARFRVQRSVTQFVLHIHFVIGLFLSIFLEFPRTSALPVVVMIVILFFIRHLSKNKTQAVS